MTMTSERGVHPVVLCAALLTTATVAPVAQAGATSVEAPVAAVWHPQVVRFEYRAGGTLYTCRSLQRKVQRILLRLGAREQARFIRFYCGDLSRIVTAEIALVLPMEATEENLRRLTDFDSKDVLIARLQGLRLPAAADLPLFPAAWKTVSLAGMRFARGDCELLQQLRQQVLPQLSVRIVSDNLQQCSTVFARSAAPQLVVQALVAEPVDRVVEAR
jgi:hypothetical protein